MIKHIISKWTMTSNFSNTTKIINQIFPRTLIHIHSNSNRKINPANKHLYKIIFHNINNNFNKINTRCNKTNSTNNNFNKCKCNIINHYLILLISKLHRVNNFLTQINLTCKTNSRTNSFQLILTYKNNKHRIAFFHMEIVLIHNFNKVYKAHNNFLHRIVQCL